MEQLIAWLSRLFGSWKPFVVVAPWEVAVLVRLGRQAGALGPGPHWRIPFLDQVTLVNTRLRVSTTPPVTMGNGRAGYARVQRANIGYVVHDPVAAVSAYNQPEAAVIGLMQAKLAGGHGVDDALAELERNGVHIVWHELVEDASIRTLRLIQGDSGIWGGVPSSGPPGGSQVY